MKSTTDIWFASFLLIKGIELTSFEKTKPRKGEYRFNLPEEAWKKYKLEFFNSEFVKMRQAQERLKDLVY